MTVICTEMVALKVFRCADIHTGWNPRFTDTNTNLATNFNMDFEHKQMMLDEITLDPSRWKTTLSWIKQKEDRLMGKVNWERSPLSSVNSYEKHHDIGQQVK